MPTLDLKQNSGTRDTMDEVWFIIKAIPAKYVTPMSEHNAHAQGRVFWKDINFMNLAMSKKLSHNGDKNEFSKDFNELISGTSSTTALIAKLEHVTDHVAPSQSTKNA